MLAWPKICCFCDLIFLVLFFFLFGKRERHYQIADSIPFSYPAVGAYEFSSADPKLKTLQSMRFASSTRLVVSEGPAITAEARIAKVWGPEVQE